MSKDTTPVPASSMTRIERAILSCSSCGLALVYGNATGPYCPRGCTTRVPDEPNADASFVTTAGTSDRTMASGACISLLPPDESTALRDQIAGLARDLADARRERDEALERVDVLREMKSAYVNRAEAAEQIIRDHESGVANLHRVISALTKERDEAQEAVQFYVKRATDAKILQQAAEATLSELREQAQLYIDQREMTLAWKRAADTALARLRTNLRDVSQNARERGARRAGSADSVAAAKGESALIANEIDAALTEASAGRPRSSLLLSDETERLIAIAAAQPKQVLTGPELRGWAERLAADSLAHDEAYGPNYEGRVAEGTVSPAPATAQRLESTGHEEQSAHPVSLSSPAGEYVAGPADAVPLHAGDEPSRPVVHGPVPEGRTPPDRVAALADLAYARASHLEWAEHLEAHVASGVLCTECEDKPYKLNAAHEREWVAKYDRLIAIVEAAFTGAGPAPPDDMLDIYVPGRLRCPQCAFELTRARISAATGEIGMGKSEVYMESSPCPNDGTPMARVTWQQEAASNQEYAMRLIADILAASGADSLPAAFAKLKAGAGPAPQDQTEKDDDLAARRASTPLSPQRSAASPRETDPQDSMRRTESMAFVIERHINSELRYWNGRSLTKGWHTCHTEAVRFARREDADRVLAWLLDSVGNVVQHLWTEFQQAGGQALTAEPHGAPGSTTTKSL